MTDHSSDAFLIPSRGDERKAAIAEIEARLATECMEILSRHESMTSDGRSHRYIVAYRPIPHAPTDVLPAPSETLNANGTVTLTVYTPKGNAGQEALSAQVASISRNEAHSLDIRQRPSPIPDTMCWEVTYTPCNHKERNHASPASSDSRAPADQSRAGRTLRKGGRPRGPVHCGAERAT